MLILRLFGFRGTGALRNDAGRGGLCSRSRACCARNGIIGTRSFWGGRSGGDVRVRAIRTTAVSTVRSRVQVNGRHKTGTATKNRKDDQKKRKRVSAVKKDVTKWRPNGIRTRVLALKGPPHIDDLKRRPTSGGDCPRCGAGLSGPRSATPISTSPTDRLARPARRGRRRRSRRRRQAARSLRCTSADRDVRCRTAASRSPGSPPRHRSRR